MEKRRPSFALRALAGECGDGIGGTSLANAVILAGRLAPFGFSIYKMRVFKRNKIGGTSLANAVIFAGRLAPVEMTHYYLCFIKMINHINQ